MIVCLRLVAVVLLSVLALPVQAATPDGVKVLRNVAYGPDKLQTMDVYLPAESNLGAKAAPVVLMVHGGGWRRGDKRQSPVLREQGRALGAEGLHLRLGQLPDGAGERSGRAGRRYRARARRGPEGGAWLGRRSRALHPDGPFRWGASGLAAQCRSQPRRQARRQAMARHRLARQRRARRAGDHESSPSRPLRHRVRRRSRLVGSRFADASPDQGRPALARRLLEHRAAPHAAPTRSMPKRRRSSASRAEVLGQALNHGEINGELGKPGAYTDAVEAFMASLDPSVAALLKP